MKDIKYNIKTGEVEVIPSPGPGKCIKVLSYDGKKIEYEILPTNSLDKHGTRTK